MRLSYLLAALTGILYALYHLSVGQNWDFKYFWWAVIVTLVVYILEGLLQRPMIVRIPERRNRAEA